MKKFNEEIETLQFRLNELKQDVMLAEGETIPFEIVNQIMEEFGNVFETSSTRQQRKQMLHLILSKITIDSIKLQINEDVIKYLKKDELSNKKCDSSFFHLVNTGNFNFKIVI